MPWCRELGLFLTETVYSSESYEIASRFPTLTFYQRLYIEKQQLSQLYISVHN